MTNAKQITLSRVNALIDKMNEINQELRVITSELIRDCGECNVFTFNDFTGYPYFHDDSIGETEAILAIKGYKKGELRIQTQADCEFFDPHDYGRIDYYEICNTILSNTPIVM